MTRLILYVVSIIELAIGVVVLGAIASDIQIILAAMLIGFALTHFGIAVLLGRTAAIRSDTRNA